MAFQGRPARDHQRRPPRTLLCVSHTPAQLKSLLFAAGGWEYALGAHIDRILDVRLTTFEQRIRGVTNAACADLERRLATAVRSHVETLERRLAAALKGMAAQRAMSGRQDSLGTGMGSALGSDRMRSHP